jgi:hypothetical protein
MADDCGDRHPDAELPAPEPKLSRYDRAEARKRLAAQRSRQDAAAALAGKLKKLDEYLTGEIDAARRILHTTRRGLHTSLARIRAAHRFSVAYQARSLLREALAPPPDIPEPAAIDAKDAA